MTNDYEREVLRLNRRRQWRTRILALSAGAIVIAAALWASDVFNQGWWRTTVAANPEVSAPATGVPPPVVPMRIPEVNPSPEFADDGAVGKLSLKATQPGRNAREGTAQIATGLANPLTYIAGALLANGTSLVEVHSDHVVLRRGEVSTTLYLETMAGKKPVHEELLEVTAPLPPTRKIEQSLQPETYASIVRAAPRFADNKVIGFEVYGGTNPGAMYQLGLQPGDVLLELDGRAVSSVEQLHRGLRSIKGGAAVLATVLRGTEQVVLSLDGTKLVGSPSPSPLAGGPGP